MCSGIPNFTSRSSIEIIMAFLKLMCVRTVFARPLTGHSGQRDECERGVDIGSRRGKSGLVIVGSAASVMSVANDVSVVY